MGIYQSSAQFQQCLHGPLHLWGDRWHLGFVVLVFSVVFAFIGTALPVSK